MADSFLLLTDDAADFYLLQGEDATFAFADAARGPQGAAGPNRISDTTAVDPALTTESSPAFLLGVNAAGTYVRRVATSSGGGFTEPVTFTQPVTFAAASYCTTPAFAAGVSRTQTLYSASHLNTGGTFTTSLTNTAFAEGDDLVFNTFQFNGNADSRQVSTLPAVSQNIEFTYRSGVNYWQIEPHLLKYNVGAAGDPSAVRADTWMIQGANVAAWTASHGLQAHTHTFVCFAPTSVTTGSAMVAQARNHVLAWDYVRLFDSHLTIAGDNPYANLALTFDLPLRIESAGYSTPLQLNGAVTIDDGATTVSGSGGLVVSAGSVGGVCRVLLGAQPGGTNEPLLLAREREFGGDAAASAGFTAAGQLKLGQVGDTTAAGLNQSIFEDHTDPSFLRLLHKNYPGTVAQIVQVPANSTGLPLLTAGVESVLSTTVAGKGPRSNGTTAVNAYPAGDLTTTASGAFDLAVSCRHRRTLDGTNGTVTISNDADGMSWQLHLTQDATGGRSVTFSGFSPTYMDSVTPSTTAGKLTVYAFTRSGTTYYCWRSTQP